jgi:hypothetical protein
MFRRNRTVKMSNDELMELLSAMYSQLSDEMLLHTTRCAAHLLALRTSSTPRTIYDTLFSTERCDEDWLKLIKTLAE